MIVILDAAPLGLAVHPKVNTQAEACQRWLADLSRSGRTTAVPEIADFEVRREAIRIGSTTSIARLDGMQQAHVYLPITTAIIRQAAFFWALARRCGRPTAPDNHLDADMILAATAHAVAQAGETAIIATTNVRHLSLFADARLWSEIT